MKFSNEFGIRLDQDMRDRLSLAVTFFRSKNQFAHACHIPGSCVFHWLRPEDTTAKREQSQWITWDVWKNIRPVLLEYHLIDLEDVRWMVPSEMRALLQKQQESSDLDKRMLEIFHALDQRNKSKAINLVKILVNE